MKAILLIVVVITVIVIAGCGSTSTSSPVADDSAAVSDTQTPEDIINQHPDLVRTFCTNYNALVDQGWNNDTIYSELDAAGAFDDWAISGHEGFDALVRWCYAH